jgi:hypothetical protein
MEIQRLLSRNAISAPASLVELTRADQIQISPSLNSLGDVDDHLIDRPPLPEAGTPRPRLFPIDAQPSIHDTPTLNFSSARTHSLEPLPSPVPVQPRTAAAASISQQSSTQSAKCSTSTARETHHFAARDTEKCSGDSSLCNDTAPIIRAPKRIYENLLDDTHFRGVLHPTELLRKLTSKQTPQRVAEQGRRNRMNSALQELATLLPKGCKKDSGGGNNIVQGRDSGDGGRGGSEDSDGKAWAEQGPATKASIVESAIEYIKQLKMEVDDANERARLAEKKLRMSRNREGTTVIRRLSFASQS